MLLALAPSMCRHASYVFIVEKKSRRSLGGYLRYTAAHSTCAAVGDEILLFGGDSMLHSFGDLDYHVDQAKDKDRGEVMVDRITEMFYEESIDHVYAYGEPEDASWQRSLDQSEDAAATVVHI